MRTLFFILSVCILVHTTVSAQKLNVHPKPQSIKIEGKEVGSEGQIQKTITPGDMRIIGEEQADLEAVGLLRKLFRTTNSKKSYPVYIGEKGDKAVKAYASMIPSVAGGYYLSVTPKKLVIAGFDERGTFYALQTLKQLVQENQLPEIEITDFPNIIHRGTVEGFYGQPWSHRDRISQLNFYGANKLNTYIYGPKDDPYHSCPNWRKAYPENEAKQISELVEVAKANKVDFVWAIHPGQDIKWNDADRDMLIHKFELMYQLGVRSFAVFFDDISGEGTNPAKQAELLNYLYNQFMKKKPDCAQLIICPTEYNKSWANQKPGSYLDILGDQLHPAIQIMWTGDRVMSDITVEGLKYINARLKRPAYIWWNFPVSDYVRNHLLLGRAYGLDPNAINLMSGFVSNPMDKAEASKVAIYSIADYGWNTSKYDATQEWEDAIRNILPSSAAAFRTFATHNSDPGKNGHGYRREESVEIKPTVDRIMSGASSSTSADFATVYKEFTNIHQSGKELLTNQDNPELIKEIKPWLEQFQLLGALGTAAMDLSKQELAQTGNTGIADSWNSYLDIQQINTQKMYIDQNNNKNSNQPGIKTGSLVMQPLADFLVKESGDHLLARVNGKTVGTPATGATIPVIVTDVKQVEKAVLQQADQSVAITPLLEVVRIDPKQYIGIDLPLTLHFCRLEINLNNKNVNEWGRLEISADGKKWEQLKPEIKGTTLLFNVQNKAVQKVRFHNTDTSTQQVHLRKFEITSEEFSGKSGNTMRALDHDLSTSFRLYGNTVIKQTTDKRPATITLFTGKVQAPFSVIAIDKKGKKHVLATQLTQPYNTFSLKNIPAEVTAIEITSETPLEIHEIVWAN